jgi:hypothetical protein
MLPALLMLAAAPFAFATPQQPVPAAPQVRDTAALRADSIRADSVKKKGMQISVSIGGSR